jgi:hypothetical protein
MFLLAGTVNFQNFCHQHLGQDSGFRFIKRPVFSLTNLDPTKDSVSQSQVFKNEIGSNFLPFLSAAAGSKN